MNSENPHFCQITVQTLGCIEFDDSGWSLCHPAYNSKFNFHKTLLGRNPTWRSLLCSFTGIVFPNSAAFSVSDSLLHICSSATTCSYYSRYQVWQTWAYSLVFMQLACWHTDVSRWILGSRDGCNHSIAESTVDVPIRLFRQISVLAPRCSRALLHNLQPTSDRRLIFANHLATGMIPAIAIICRLLSFQGTRGSFKYFPKNALLSFCRGMKSAVHVPMQPCAEWLILSCSALARMYNFRNFPSSV